MSRQLVVVAHNLRSAHNVGSLLRTAEGLGIQRVILTGYTPYPATDHDPRLPHEQAAITRRIHKTALGAESSLSWSHHPVVNPVIATLKQEGYLVAALEQQPSSQSLPKFKAPHKLALVIGREVEGIEPSVIALCDTVLEIPMAGQKESFNVVQAAAMALYQLAFF